MWAGLLFGVSFLATPVKFAAPSLTLGVALDVGQTTFHLLVKVEWAMLLLLLAATAFARFPTLELVVLVLLAAGLAVQTFLLLPPLDERVAAIIAGETLPASRLHLAYIAVEVLKLLALLGGAFAGIRLLRLAA
ncbi:MAG: hypothetical protein KIS96_06675 [Bauldia sp.]|nr:hypothetical protein [Bauldia sp.]